MDAKDKKYAYERHGMKGARAGQAVHDILSKDQPTYTAEDILDAYAPKYMADLEKCVDENKSKYQSPFYIYVLSHKEMWAENIVRNWFIARQTPPYALDMVVQYPHQMKTLYMVDTKIGKIKLLWTLPGLEDCKSIVKEKHKYDPDLVKWIEMCFSGQLDRDTYSFA